MFLNFIDHPRAGRFDFAPMRLGHKLRGVSPVFAKAAGEADRHVSRDAHAPCH
jgi:hypothetical protein